MTRQRLSEFTMIRITFPSIQILRMKNINQWYSTKILESNESSFDRSQVIFSNFYTLWQIKYGFPQMAMMDGRFIHLEQNVIPLTQIPRRKPWVGLGRLLRINEPNSKFKIEMVRLVTPTLMEMIHFHQEDNFLYYDQYISTSIFE